MNRISLGSVMINNQYHMFRVQAPKHQVQEYKDKIMSLMNDFLENNDGKLINLKIMKNDDICCYFVTGQYNRDWFTIIQNSVLKGFQLVQSSIEIKSTNIDNNE